MKRRHFLAAGMAAPTALQLLAEGPNTPRPAIALDIVMPDGSKTSLSKFAGKVCVIEFLFTTCPHCQETSKVLSRMNKEYGAKGFQALGGAFNDNAMMLVPAFVRDYQVNYPVGVVPREKVLEFLGFSMMQRLSVPLVAFIDRKGVLRHQSTPEGAEVLHNEQRMRQLIEELLKEPAPPVKKSLSMNK